MELAEDSFWLPRRLVGHGTLFMLKVKGDSMTGAAIADGDLVVIRQQPVAENGEIVAARLGGTSTDEATVKTLQRLDGHPWLMPQPIPATVPSSWAGGGRCPPSPASAEPAARLTQAAAGWLRLPPRPRP